MNTVTIERFDDSHLPAVASLLRRVFGHSPTLDELRRKYDTSHLGVGRFGFVALDRGQAVAFALLLPQRFSDGGETFLLAQVADAATDPAYRRSGLSREILDRSQDLARASGIRGVWGFPTGHGIDLLRAMGWTFPGALHLRTIRSGAIPFGSAAFRIPGAAAAFVAIADRLLRLYRIDPREFCNPLAKEGWICQAYGPELLGYRRFTPNRLIRVGEANCWIRLGRELRIGSLDASGPTEAVAAVGELRRLARRLGIGELAFMTPPDSLLDSWLEPVAAATPGWEVAVAYADLPVDRLRLQFGDLDGF